VAGVAACRDSEVLALFLRFIQHAVSVGPSKHRVAFSGRPSRRRALLDDIFIGREFILPKLPGPRGKLLGRLHLILASEPAFWVGISPCYSVDWTVTFDRRVRYFKGIRDLDDYWACRYKLWEAPDEAPYPVVAAGTSLDEAIRLQLLRDHPDLLADILLVLQQHPVIPQAAGVM
jgi:hypothetical protein